MREVIQYIKSDLIRYTGKVGGGRFCVNMLETKLFVGKLLSD